LSRLNDLIRQVSEKDPALAADLQREVAALADRRSFGLNFERHVPEAVELPGRRVRRGDKVRILPSRGNAPKKSDEKLWRVTTIKRDGDSVAAELLALADDTDAATSAVEDLVIVAEFRDPIYPGLVSTGKVERGGDKPYHTVINAENFHALQLLMFTHRGKVDCIYIDPPYNTGARDWKYNNDYVESDDHYRHSKWLAFMERRLLLAKELLNPSDSVLIVTIDEKECSRLGLLLQQVFLDVDIQMVSSVISPQGSARPGGFARVDEYIFFVRLGASTVSATGDDMLVEAESVAIAPVWFSMIRSGTEARREDRKDVFYPIFVETATRRVVEVGLPLPLGTSRDTILDRPGCETVWPIRRDGSEGRWQLSPATFRKSLDDGFAKIGEMNNTGGRSVMYVRTGDRAKIARGDIVRAGTDAWGYPQYSRTKEGAARRAPKSVWNKLSHDAGKQGSMLLARVLPGRTFPFPKALYAVEDALRFFIGSNTDAVILDFFAGSGTTAHAVMRLNKQDDGRRQCISVTNNEVSSTQQIAMRSQGLRPGDNDWEKFGIYDYIAKPRIEAAITGTTPDGELVKGDYKFIDEFPMSEGFEENVEFFTLTYEAPLRVASNRDFERIAPLLWIRAGSRGPRVDEISKGWDVAETYGVIADFDRADEFLRALEEPPDATHAFVVTDEDWLFESVCRQLPEHVEPVRLYEAYLRNFEIEAGRGAR
jgi:adenine-specific DNA-methyltransferase